MTAAGQILGTAAYLSPEQARGRPATPASDRYSLAVVAFELLCGRRPFDGDTPMAQARARVEQEPAVPTGPCAAAGDVLAWGLAREAADRPATAAAFVAALEDALGDAAQPTRVTAVMPQAGAGPAAALRAGGLTRRLRAGTRASACDASRRRIRWHAAQPALPGVPAGRTDGGLPRRRRRGGADQRRRQRRRPRTAAPRGGELEATGSRRGRRPRPTPSAGDERRSSSTPQHATARRPTTVAPPRPSTTRATRCCRAIRRARCRCSRAPSRSSAPRRHAQPRLRLLALQLRLGAAPRGPPGRGDPAARRAPADLQLQARDRAQGAEDGAAGGAAAEALAAERRRCPTSSPSIPSPPAASASTTRCTAARAPGCGAARRSCAKARWASCCPIHAWLIEHPEGLILVDAGETHAARSATFAEFHVTRDDELDHQLKAADFAPADVTTVVLTHIHGDHIDGLPHVPSATVLANEREIAIANSPMGRLQRAVTRQPLPPSFAPVPSPSTARPSARSRPPRRSPPTAASSRSPRPATPSATSRSSSSSPTTTSCSAATRPTTNRSCKTFMSMASAPRTTSRSPP